MISEVSPRSEVTHSESSWEKYLSCLRKRRKHFRTMVDYCEGGLLSEVLEVLV